MRILIVISEAPPIKSGVSRVAEKLSQGLTARRHTVDLLSFHDIPRLEWGEIRLSSMPLKLRELRSRLIGYDLINLHGPVPTFSDVFLLSGLRGLGKARPRLVYTHHAPIDLKLPGLSPFLWIYNQLQERLAALADHVVVTTPSYGQRLARYVPTGKLSVIPWGVDYQTFTPPEKINAPFTVVYLGQMRPYKGLPVLLQAVRGLDQLRVWVIGDGHAAERYRRKAINLGLPDVTFWGQIPDDQVVRLLQAAHVIALPSVSRSEAFGIALLEGMAAGLVPVASHLPGVADLVGNEGFTIPAGNPEALRDILLRLRDDRALRTHLGYLAQAKARLYGWERAVFGYERVFDRLLGQPGTIIHPPASERPTLPVLRQLSDITGAQD